MDLHPSEEPSGPARGSGSLAELGTFFVDSDVIFGFTRHLLRRKAKVRAQTGAQRSTSWLENCHKAEVLNNTSCYDYHCITPISVQSREDSLKYNTITV